MFQAALQLCNRRYYAPGIIAGWNNESEGNEAKGVKFLLKDTTAVGSSTSPLDYQTWVATMLYTGCNVLSSNANHKTATIQPQLCMLSIEAMGK